MKRVIVVTNGIDEYQYKNDKLYKSDGSLEKFDEYWYKDGQLHKEDGPAIKYANGDKYWYYKGKYIKCSSQLEFEQLINKKKLSKKKIILTVVKTKIAKYYYKDKAKTILHRKNGPAIEYIDGSKVWYQDGKVHRLDGPAKEYISGTKFWYQNDKLHRENGPAIEYCTGTKEWYKDNHLHREDGPAVEMNDGSKFYYIYDMLHRLNGPAIEDSNSNKLWYFKNKEINCSSQKEFEKIINRKLFKK